VLRAQAAPIARVTAGGATGGQDPHVGDRGVPSAGGGPEKYGGSEQGSRRVGGRAGGALSSGSVAGEILLRAPPEQARCGPRRPSQPFPGCLVGLSSCSFVIGSFGWEPVRYSAASH
jgi:hypothetical protein